MLRRVACVEIPDLPIQLLLRANPGWRDMPVAVVADDAPEAPLVLINRRAREMRLRTGMRFGAAKSLLPELCVGTVSAVEVEKASAQLVRDLQTFSPHVERDPVSPGVFYVDPSGLSHLYGGELSWARSVQRYLMGRKFYSSVVVAFGRALTHALARVTRSVRVLDSVEQTLQRAREVPLMRLHIDPKLRDGLALLGFSTLGDLTNLGADQLGIRFGKEAAALCRVAHGEEVLPLCAEPHVDTPRTELEVDPPDDDVARLCFVIKRVLDQLLENVRQRGESVRALWLRLTLLRSPPSVQRLEPSQPTRDPKLLLELLRLRLTALSLESPVVAVALEAETSEPAPGQLSMFVPKRDLAAGDRAIARLKASFGEDVVCRAELEDAHLPEAKVRWIPLDRVERPRVADNTELTEFQPLVRRFLKKPEPLSGACEKSASGQLMFTHGGEPYALTGPYRINGGWWVKEVSRDYYYARSQGGALWWVFYDNQRASWFLQATVD